MTAPIIGRRALNRALLARQLLLERVDRPVVEVVEHLVPIQAQVPVDPYVALWSRIHGFDAQELSGMIERREAVRGTLHRGTLHLATTRDFLAQRPLVQPVVERVFQSGSPFGRRLPGVDLQEVLDVALLLIDERPRTRSDLRSLLGERWPDRDADALAYAVAYLMPLVQVPPRGLWQRSGAPLLARLETWVGAAMDARPDLDRMILRYLAAFGPASPADAAAWSGLRGLGEVFQRLRPQLVEFRTEVGRTLFDLPEAPRPDPGVPAPIRFLPQYDNVVLGHADRSRIVPDGARALALSQVWVGSFLLDGMLGGTWRVRDERSGVVLDVAPREPLPPATTAELEREAWALVAFLRPSGSSHTVRVADAIT